MAFPTMVPLEFTDKHTVEENIITKVISFPSAITPPFQKINFEQVTVAFPILEQNS